jgi:hypothetical protein
VPREIRDQLEKTQRELRETKAELESVRARLEAEQRRAPQVVVVDRPVAEPLPSVEKLAERPVAPATEQPGDEAWGALFSLFIGLALTGLGLWGLVNGSLDTSQRVISLTLGPLLLLFAWRQWRS